jgi:quinoprotein glucose dehydrogenase
MSISFALALFVVSADEPYRPFIHGPSKEAEASMAGFQTAPGIKVELIAAEPMLANPVVFTIDRRGRFFVAETFRLHQGVTDTRGHMYWLDDDLACRTVEDRVAMYKKHLGAGISGWSTEHDRVRVLWSSTGGLKPDKSEVFADGFKNLADGIGSGLLVRDDAVYWTCIPDLWKLEETKADNKADKRQSLASGFGVHVAFIGHDLHGLKLGPDGRIYFSIGDRGLHVKNREGVVLDNPDSGAVLRCEPDGSNLELFATGLRNPQELAFDEFGNLFTCDNNSDGGDRARWLHLVEGGEYGWRIGYQYHDEPTIRGPWNNEMLWRPDVSERAAYLLPPLRNYSDGPSGLVYNPGVTRFGDRWKNSFFLCDFRGTPAQSGIRIAKLKPKGAGFEFDSDDQVVWRTLVTDCEFGPDGGLYFTDWVDGWSKPNKGRIYRLADPALEGDRNLAAVQKLFNDGFNQRPAQELLELLSHPDMRIRQEAQESLVKRKATTKLREAAGGGDVLRRLHGIYGLGHLLRSGTATPDVVGTLRTCLRANDANLRGKAALMLAEGKVASLASEVAALLNDSDPRVRRDAAFAVAKFGPNKSVAEVLIRQASLASERDPILRHALVIALSKTATPDVLLSAINHRTSSVKLVGLLAMRRTKDPNLARLVGDPDLFIAREAARAVYDGFIDAALPSLADHAKAPRHRDDPYLRRIVAANYRLGGTEHASNLASLAAMRSTPEPIRKECLFELGRWLAPNGKDRVQGIWRPIAARSADAAKSALLAKGPAILAAAGPDSKRQWAEAVRLLGAKEAVADVRKLAAEAREPAVVRTEAIRTLAAFNDEQLPEIVKAALKSNDAELRAEARSQLAAISPKDAVPALADVVASGSRVERQAALATLGGMPIQESEAALLKEFDRWQSGGFPKDAELDLMLAAEKRNTPSLKAKLDAAKSARKKDDPLAEYRVCLEGGDASKGRSLFYNKAEVYCLRCHRVGSAGGEVGPNLAEIAKKQTREYLLEAIVAPSAKIAQGYESVVVELEDGRTLAGVFRTETPTELHLITAEAKNIVLDKKLIVARKRGPSAMPQDAIKHLSKKELRDLIEYLVVQPKA